MCSCLLLLAVSGKVTEELVYLFCLEDASCYVFRYAIASFHGAEMT